MGRPGNLDYFNSKTASERQLAAHPGREMKRWGLQRIERGRRTQHVFKMVLRAGVPVVKNVDIDKLVRLMNLMCNLFQGGSVESTVSHGVTNEGDGHPIKPPPYATHAADTTVATRK